MPPQEIPSETLKSTDVPEAGAAWSEIQEFALTFNGYSFWNGFDRCAAIANAKQPQNLTELRTCLFFEQRRWRHFGETPDAESMAYIRTLVNGIREEVDRIRRSSP